MILRLFALCLCLLALSGCKSEDTPTDEKKDDPIARAQVADAQIDVAKLQQAIEIYHVMYGVPPAALTDLIETPDGNKILEKLPRDPWGAEYRLEAGKDGVSPYSVGPDGVPFSEDDVRDTLEPLDTGVTVTPSTP